MKRVYEQIIRESELVGKAIERIEFDEDYGVFLFFEDSTFVIFSGSNLYPGEVELCEDEFSTKGNIYNFRRL